MKKYLLSLCMVLALVACKDDKNADTEVKPVIKIGAILPLTGDNSTMGASLKAGTLAAIEDKAKENLKYRYEAVFEDNQHLPAKSATTAIKLLNIDKANVLLSFATGSGRVVAPLAENAKVLHVCSTLEDENAAPMGKTSFFQGPTLQSYQKLLVKALQKENVQKLALLAANVGVACVGTERIAEMLKNKGLETEVECFNPADRDFRFAVQKYLSKGFENFYIQFFPPQTDIVIRLLREHNVAPNHVFGSGMDTGADVTLFEDMHHLGGNSGSLEFVDRLMEEYHINNVYMAASAYDLISLAIDAFENVEDKTNIDEVVAYIKAHATRKCMSGDCRLLDNGFIANEAEWRTYKHGKPVPFGD